MITFDKFVSVTTTRGTMMKAITISRQNDTENLVLLVALVLESNGLYCKLTLMLKVKWWNRGLPKD